MSSDSPHLESRQAQEDSPVECELPGQFHFDMIQRGDFIRPGRWHWRCRREDVSGNVAYGYVQADPLGKLPFPETFENDQK